MKNNLDYYINQPYRLNIVPDLEEGGYAAQYPELPGCITCADTIEELFKLAEDAKRCWITVAYNAGDEIPLPKESGQVIIPKKLYENIEDIAHKKGIGVDQYCESILEKFAV